MTLDHFGKPIINYLYQCFGFFTAAEGFFFLSGFVGMLAAMSKKEKDPTQGWMRKRAGRIWLYHIATVFAIYYCAVLFLPRILWMFKPFTYHAGIAHLYSALLVYTPEWMDVLPLYVLLLLAGSLAFRPFTKAKNRIHIFLMWLPSLALWIASQFGIRELWTNLFPKWVEHGFFDIFGWQFVYFTGAATAAWWRIKTDSCKAIDIVKKISPFSIIPLLFCFLWIHQILPLEQPGYWLINKDHVGLLRFANFFLFVMFISMIVRRFPKALDFRITNTIGKHSLDVYSAHIICLYAWFAVPKDIQFSSPWNVIAPIVTCLLLYAMAALLERKKARH